VEAPPALFGVNQASALLLPPGTVFRQCLGVCISAYPRFWAATLTRRDAEIDPGLITSSKAVR